MIQQSYLSHRIRSAARVVFCASVFLLFTGGCKANEPKVRAPDFVLQDLSGEKLTLEKFKGKVLFIEFWATWCTPCIVSIPEVEKMMKEYNDSDVAVVSISLDNGEEEVRRFPLLDRMSQHTALAGESGVEINYRVDGIPAFYLIDQEGYLVGSWQGFHPSMTKVWRKELNRLLNV